MKQAMTLIRQHYREFSETNRKIADFILMNPTQILKMAGHEIAAITQTSPASVTRFARQIGYDGLEELKFALASEQSGLSEKSVTSVFEKEDTVEELTQKVGQLIKNSIDDLQYTMVRDELQQGIELVKKAKTIYLLGIGASSLTTYNLYHKFNRSGKKAIYNFDSHMNLEFLNYSTQKDVVIAVSYSGLSKEVLVGCEIAKKNKTPIIFITRNTSDRIVNISDVLLAVPDNEHLVRVGAISSITTSMAVGDMLYIGSIQEKLDGEISERMIQTNQLIRTFKEGS